MKTYFRPCAIPQLSRVCVCCRVLMYEMSRVLESVIALEHPHGPKEFWDVQLQLVKCGNATRVFLCVCQFMKSQPAVCACVRAPAPSLKTVLPNAVFCWIDAEGWCGAPSGNKEVMQYGPELYYGGIPLDPVSFIQARKCLIGCHG